MATATNMTLHILFSLLGLYNGYVLMQLNLLLIVNISKTMKFVVKSITLHFDQLLQTLILTLFVIFVFTMIIAEKYQATIDNTENLCIDIDTCFIFTLNWGLRNGGGVADSMIVQPDGDSYLEKNLHDVFFFIIINVVALNIIFGIIIDTFQQLRDSSQERDEDKSNICFVCGNERSEFSKQGVSFSKHIEEQHNPWNYLYYLYYLQDKGEDDLSGIEYYTWSQFQEISTDYLPIGDTQYISGGEDEIGELKEYFGEKIEELNDNMKNMFEKLAKMIKR